MSGFPSRVAALKGVLVQRFSRCAHLQRQIAMTALGSQPTLAALRTNDGAQLIVDIELDRLGDRRADKPDVC